MILTKDYTKLFSGEFTFYYNNDAIVVTTDKYGTHLFDNDVVYFFNTYEATADSVFEILNAQSDIPQDLKKFIEARVEPLLGKTIPMVSDAIDTTRFCENKDFAVHYGIDTPIDVKLEIVAVFDSAKEFDYSFNENQDKKYAFGIWIIEDAQISSSFIFGHPVQTKMCFADFGESELKKGSKFLKMRIIFE